MCIEYCGNIFVWTCFPMTEPIQVIVKNVCYPIPKIWRWAKLKTKPLSYFCAIQNIFSIAQQQHYIECMRMNNLKR